MEHGPWRVVWLDNVEQGLAYRDAIASAEGRFAHDPHAIGFEYVRAMATVGRLRRWDRRRDVPRRTPCASDSAREPSPRFSVLCWDDDGAARWRLRRRSRTSRESVSTRAAHHRRGDFSTRGNEPRADETHFWIEIDDAANFLAKEAAANRRRVH